MFREIFPIKSYDEAITLEFISYDIEEPKATALESLQTGETFSAGLYVTFKLKDESGTKKERVYMGEMPMMTRRGTFVINGAERVIVSQLHRSPGICFETSTHLNGKTLTPSGLFQTVVHGWKPSLTPTICFTSTSTDVAVVVSSSPPPSCAPWAGLRIVISVSTFITSRSST